MPHPEQHPTIPLIRQTSVDDWPGSGDLGEEKPSGDCMSPERRCVVAVFDKSRQHESFHTWMVFCNDGTIWRVTQEVRGAAGFTWTDFSTPRCPKFSHLPQHDEYTPASKEYQTT